jgi:hypothetical protein
MKQTIAKMVRQYEALAIVLGALGAVTTAVAFLFLTFMTISAGEKSEASVRSYVDGEVKNLDTRISRNENTLVEIKALLLQIDGRVYDLHKERGAHGKTRD